jgi:hypothetical protein
MTYIWRKKGICKLEIAKTTNVKNKHIKKEPNA